MRVVAAGKALEDRVGHCFGRPDLVVGSGDEQDGGGGIFDGNFGGDGGVFLAEGVAVKIDEADGATEGDHSNGGQDAESSHGVRDEGKMPTAVGPGGALGVAGSSFDGHGWFGGGRLVSRRIQESGWVSEAAADEAVAELSVNDCAAGSD